MQDKLPKIDQSEVNARQSFDVQANRRCLVRNAKAETLEGVCVGCKAKNLHRNHAIAVRLTAARHCRNIAGISPDPL